MPRRLAPGILLAAWLFASPPGVGAQCVMCRTALVSSEEGQAMAEKFNAGILFLLGAPFAVAGAIGVAMLRSRKRLSEGTHP